MQIPFVGFQPVKTSEHMASAGVFALLQVRKKTSVPVKDVPMHESANIVKGNWGKKDRFRYLREISTETKNTDEKFKGGKGNLKTLTCESKMYSTYGRGTGRKGWKCLGYFPKRKRERFSCISLLKPQRSFWLKKSSIYIYKIEILPNISFRIIFFPRLSYDISWFTLVAITYISLCCIYFNFYFHFIFFFPSFFCQRSWPFFVFSFSFLPTCYQPISHPVGGGGGGGIFHLLQLYTSREILKLYLHEILGSVLCRPKSRTFDWFRFYSCFHRDIQNFHHSLVTQLTQSLIRRQLSQRRSENPL